MVWSTGGFLVGAGFLVAWLLFDVVVSARFWHAAGMTSLEGFECGGADQHVRSRQHVHLSVSDRESPRLTAPSGTQRARAPEDCLEGRFREADRYLVGYSIGCVPRASLTWAVRCMLSCITSAIVTV